MIIMKKFISKAHVGSCTNANRKYDGIKVKGLIMTFVHLLMLLLP
jgi:hypothetical protein